MIWCDGQPAMRLVQGWRDWADRLRVDTFAVYLACRDPRTPWYAKVFAGCVVAYAFSPLDLVPDFIPIVGYLDDLILVPVGIAIALRMIPPLVLEESRGKARGVMARSPVWRWGPALVVIAIWVSMLALAAVVVARAVGLLS
jgi:uncharacterized membrane protein YkvA (DUF1232 family)